MYLSVELQVIYLEKAQRRKVLKTFFAALRLCEKTSKKQTNQLNTQKAQYLQYLISFKKVISNNYDIIY